MTEFTPGPWKVEQFPDIGMLEIWRLSDGYTDLICSIECQMPGFNEDEANARLIAAAPMLYEALVNADYAVWYMANNGLEGDMIDWEERFNQLTEAIALVKGE